MGDIRRPAAGTGGRRTGLLRLTLFYVSCLVMSGEDRTLTLWLIPFEPAKNGPQTATGIQTAIEDFNRTFPRGSAIEVLNTTDDALRQQLFVWNRVFSTPNWNMIAGQERTLQELRRFTSTRGGVKLRVLFVDWGRLLPDLDEALEHGSPYAPDVAVVGSTWVAWLGARGRLLGLPLEDGDLRFRDLPGQPRASLRYTSDIRLLFYWKRFPTDDPEGPAFTPDTQSWPSLIRDFRTRAEASPQALPPLVIQAGFTQNLLHDYIPLIQSEGASFLNLGAIRTRVDMTSPEALKVPILLASSAVGADHRGWAYRLLVFPEQTHEESARFFMNGEYSATVEPLPFLKRWYEHFMDSAGERRRASFWSYAGVAALRKSFRGGSDMVVLKRTANPEDASRLATFLVSQGGNRDILAGFGNLSGVGKDADGTMELPEVDEFFKTMPEGPATTREPSIQRMKHEIALALRSGGEYPDWLGWPTKIESKESLEAMQTLIRRVGEGNADGLAAMRVTNAAHEAEHAINVRLDPFLRAWERAKDYWLFVAAALGVAFVLVSREKRAYASLRKVRGPAAVTLLATEASHVRDRLIKQTHHAESREQARKALMVSAAIRGWRRGLSDANWEPAPVRDVVSSALIVALVSLYAPDLFRAWEEGGRLRVDLFLKEIRLMRISPEPGPDAPPFFLEIHCPATVRSTWPFMLEQALVCLLQNSIQASRGDGHYRPIYVAYDAGQRAIGISDYGGPMSKRLRVIINHSKSVDQFERLVLKLLNGHPRHRPGIGLVEAFCIARHCYGGLRFSTNPNCATIYLDAKQGASHDDTHRGRRPRTRHADAERAVSGRPHSSGPDSR